MFLPSLSDIQRSVTEAKSWLKSSLLFLVRDDQGKMPRPLLNLLELKVVIK